jgi:aminotransferase class I and II
MELSPFRIERSYARYEHSTRFMLSSSDCESRTIGALLELEPGAQEQLHQTWCGYTEPPAACDEYERAVSLGSISKSYGLPGLRTGWIATRDAALRDAVATLKDYTTICASAPSEFLTALALRHRRVLVGRNLDIVRHNLPLLDAFFERHGLGLRPAGPRPHRLRPGQHA